MAKKKVIRGVENRNVMAIHQSAQGQKQHWPVPKFND